MRDVIIIHLIQHFEADFPLKVSLKILNSGIIMKGSPMHMFRPLDKSVVNILFSYFVRFDTKCPSQPFFSHVRTIFCLPGLNQYLAV